MILTRYPLDNYPLSYRRAAYEPLLEAIKARKSVYLASLTGMGKTHLLKFLAYRRDLHQQAFGSAAENLVFVLVDFHGSCLEQVLRVCYNPQYGLSNRRPI